MTSLKVIHTPARQQAKHRRKSVMTNVLVLTSLLALCWSLVIVLLLAVVAVWP